MTSRSDQTKPFHIWEGVFPNFQAAQAEARGAGFSGEVYRARSLNAATECLDALNSAKPIPVFHKQRSTYLPLTLAMMLGCDEKVNVLDFGGGFGIGYMSIVESVPVNLNRIEYTIVEVPEVCQSGLQLHEERRINYLSTLPTSAKFDLIHAASSVQYIEHWQDLLVKFIAIKPKYILLSDIFAGSIKSYATLQNYYDSKIPHWFLNLNELLDIFSQNNYELVMKTYATSRRLEIEDTLPMSNFPEDLRLAQTLHLLLKNKVD